jgi:hypothetical protein
MNSKYEKLELFLRAKETSVSSVSMSFQEIETVLESSLPNSAFAYREWWANQRDTKGRPQAKAWLDAGFKVDSVNQHESAGSVEFVRVTGRE